MTATTTEAPAPARKTIFDMPAVRMGDIVWWSASPNDDGFCAAIVNKVGLRTVDVLVLTPNSPMPLFKSGVANKIDPRNYKADIDPTWFQGVWWHRDATPSGEQATDNSMLRDMATNLAKLVNRVNELEKKSK